MEKRGDRQPCPEARTDSAPIVEKCDDKNKKGERAGENVAATAAASVLASVRRVTHPRTNDAGRCLIRNTLVTANHRATSGH